ncbi:uncharacterized protein AMSG_09166 [Thecamonas trahens ATCC 50062]|uniref:EGF-like domain-containing protein n=1 Tax=Thecamonas trahens ATCC 50062 TaxID=461836 RepID=A0A0L0DL50_THETB|nr:hypothetical protein AMSG_09166 [Thecamonas trahens ATCC 50062]KNC52990.1 hypothetical protein AMSG_09166 [Thecamonas trahens ATCC 50062]|eukprot:XP_013754877.1 hypothetical protein AMSG_09166 [Thecamonas trahens ATCC 50062]
MIGARVLLCVVLLNYVIGMANGHGWMMDPVPRSGGGQGSGNASTSGPCGKAGSVTPVATWTTGQTVVVQYKRANNHGDTSNAVDFTLSLPAGGKTNPQPADFEANGDDIIEVISKALMDVTVSTAQSASFVVPDFNLSADATAALQFHWTPTSGASWYDCAWVTITAPPANNPCLQTANGGCHANATCTPAQTGGTRTCACRVGYIGDGITCEEAPAPITVELEVKGLNVNQNTFTANIAFVLGLPTSRILYDRSEELRSKGNSRVYFSITAAQDGSSPEPEILKLRNMFLQDDEKLDDLDLTLVELKLGNDPTEYEFKEGGQPLPGATTSSPSGRSAGETAGLVIGIIIGVAVFAAIAIAAAFFMIKKHSSGSSLPAYYPTKETVQAENQYTAGGASGTTYDRSNNYA